jgi:hypothetical protein
MSTSAPAVAPQRTVPFPAWLGLALAFAIGTASGAIAATVIVQQVDFDGAPAAQVAPTDSGVTGLALKAHAAASRGDARLSAEFSNKLAAAVGSAEIAEQLTHMAAKADTAARRGDIRLSLQFREALAAYIASLEDE